MTRGRHFLSGSWVDGVGPSFSSHDPATGDVVWSGRAATAAEVDHAAVSARQASTAWAGAPLATRAAVLEAFADAVREGRKGLADAISRETGKPHWEALTEADSVAAKVALSRQAHAERCREEAVDLGGAVGRARYRPLGVVAVFGPFNLPAHLPCGHLVPALLAGNTAVWKPSELAPAVAERVVDLWAKAGLPPGVLNLVQGGAETGRLLADHRGLDGLFFTGSYGTGRALHEALAGRPEVLLALEMGGNNPLVVWGVGDRESAVAHILLSAFLTAGQRCTCARRLVVPSGPEGDDIVGLLVARTAALRVGAPADRPEPFLGPVITPGAAERLLEAWAGLVGAGGRPLLDMRRLGRGSLLSPGIVDVTGIRSLQDRELFGPLLQVSRVAGFEEAVEEANRTAYGLSAGILTDDRALYERFREEVKAGVIHWNRPTTGASGRLPFGGAGRSGNHRPSGYLAVDYCARPVALLEAEVLQAPASRPPGME